MIIPANMPQRYEKSRAKHDLVLKRTKSSNLFFFCRDRVSSPICWQRYKKYSYGNHIMRENSKNLEIKKFLWSCFQQSNIPTSNNKRF